MDIILPPGNLEGVSSGATESKGRRIRIGLISDTHIPRDAKALPPHIREAFKGVENFYHCFRILMAVNLERFPDSFPLILGQIAESPITETQACCQSVCDFKS